MRKCLPIEIGKVYGKLTVIERVYGEQYIGNTTYLCICECGTKTTVTGSSLYHRTTVSCGCFRKKRLQELWEDKEYRNEMSAMLKNQWKDENYRNNIVSSIKKYAQTDKAKENSSSILSKLWQDEEMANQMKQASKDRWLNEEYRKKRTGENHPSWKGGITPENHKTRNSVEYSNWRNLIFWFDDYICQKCGKNGGTLHAHHIVNFSENKELRFNFFNGATLCCECHEDYHKQYGYTNNNAEQLLEFLGGSNDRY